MNHDPGKKPHSVCVYCASSGVADPIHRQVARRLGGLLAQAGCTIIYGGGKAGSMGALADGALDDATLRMGLENLDSALNNPFFGAL